MDKNELVPYEGDFDFASLPEPKEEVKIRAKTHKGTNQVVQQRINEAVEIVLYQGLSVQEFREYYAKLYGVSQRTSDKVWAEIKKILRDRTEKHREDVISTQIAKYEDLLVRAREDGNKRVERETLWDLSRIMGLDQRKIDITSDGLPLDIKINLSNNPKDFQ